ncbi:hypothetical protein BGZ60DRAFT_531814 [Tricladium varicosporioides]|nr:hypothetical protein BGZ60DRAFT_531814 [Hymenoscyphus varicosporioides]
MEAVRPQGSLEGGTLVAVEGDSYTISTQLRLLPPSQKILVLPSLSDIIPETPENQCFDARAFIRDVYIAFSERTETAQSFIKSWTSAQPRLVFMNGGTICARATCISRISEKITNGNIAEAEVIFNGIVQGGVAGLLGDEGVQEVTPIEYEDVKEEITADETIQKPQDPTMKAMQDAEKLDRETAELQQEGEIHRNSFHTSEEVPIALEADFRGSVMTMPGFRSDLRTTPERNVLCSSRGDDIKRTILTVRNRPSIAGPGCPLEQRCSVNSAYDARSSYTATDTHQTGTVNDYDDTTDTFLSMTPSPGVVYGEAYLVDVQTALPEKEVKRVKSVDRFYHSNSKIQERVSGQTLKLRHTVSTVNLGGRPVSTIKIPYSGSTKLSRGTFIKASETTIKRSPISTRSSSSSTALSQIPTQHGYFDRGTDAVSDLAVKEPADDREAEFIPVFPLVEDFVIHFSDSKQNTILESVIQSYKDATYSTLPLFPKAYSDVPPSPASFSILEHSGTVSKTARFDIGLRPDSRLTTKLDDPGYQRRHSYGPYSSDNRYPVGIQQPLPSRNKLLRADSGVQMPDPPTPSRTPQLLSNQNSKFVEFSLPPTGNAISTQDSLRQLLSVHLPAGENGFSQYCYPVGPEVERLWKPVFGNDNNSSTGNEGRTVDQIIAFGSEAGVKKEFFHQISGHVERLGVKKDGVSRSAKLNITYLIANMMQTFYSLPPTTQRTFNPLSNPELLATLLVPQLEAYLASNTSTRFLMLHYPTDSLATVFALRKLLGGEMFKIAGILDSLASDPPSFVFRPRTTFNSPFSNEYPKHPRADSLQVTKQKASFANTAVTKMPSINLKQQDNPISFARADYLLPSTATDNEITTFLSGIWKTLMEKSSFYTPEPDPEPTVVKSVQAPPIPPIPRTPSRPGTPVRSRSRTRSIVTINKTHISNSATTNTGAAIRDRDRDSTYPPSRSPTLIQGAQSNNSCLHNKTGYAHSYAASIVSIRTAHTIQSERDGGRGRGGGGDKGGWENFYIGDEDSDDDEFDRMILGRLHAKIVPEVRMVDAGKWEQPERNKRKALKWLGLA